MLTRISRYHPSSRASTRLSPPRLTHMHAMHEASKGASPLLFGVPVPPTNPNLRPYRPPDYAEEWKFLRRAWSLARNGQTELSRKLITKASEGTLSDRAFNRHPAKLGMAV